MRVKFKFGNDILVCNVETVRYDEYECELQFYEFGSFEPDYCISIGSFEASRKLDLLLERGYCDFSCYDLTYNIFEEDSDDE